MEWIFDAADKLLIIDVFSAGENKIENINSERFSKEIKHKDVQYISGPIDECAKKIYPILKENDILITLGAGTVTNIGKLIEEEYKKAQ